MKCEFCGHEFKFEDKTFVGARERTDHIVTAHESKYTEMPKDKPTSTKTYADIQDKMIKPLSRLLLKHLKQYSATDDDFWCSCGYHVITAENWAEHVREEILKEFEVRVRMD